MTTATETERRSSYYDLLRSWVASSFWLACVDFYPALAAAFLPWSTSIVSFSVGIWFVVFLPTINWTDFKAILKMPACICSLALVALAIIGMVWAGGSWPERIHGLHPVLKFLILPCLLYRYTRSKRAHWVSVPDVVCCSHYNIMGSVFRWMETRNADSGRAGKQLH